ncbi:hypothetical protein F511_09667 [Dorcoceras hygrometricum]|uniref:Uncharacterized protein n=1 Tax=Dorcoceras hygrometricum TaxID=472368 RepID=A0A2Z7AHA9_9LAMI|nr:hypothetical protein F511_09667 [Dorcoceras hygrometricum]
MVSMKNPLAAILDSNRFTGLNYQDWLRNLNLVLVSEKLLYATEKSPPKEAPADISPEELVTLKQWWDDEVKARCYVMASMSNEMQRRFEKTMKSHSPKSSSHAQHIELSIRRESRIQYLCDPQWFRDTASRGPTTIAAPESQFRTCPSDHYSIGYPRMSASGESSTTMHRLLHASGSHPIPPPDDPNTTKTSDLSTRQMVTTWKVRTRVVR